MGSHMHSVLTCSGKCISSDALLASQDPEISQGIYLQTLLSCEEGYLWRHPHLWLVATTEVYLGLGSDHKAGDRVKKEKANTSQRPEA